MTPKQKLDLAMLENAIELVKAGGNIEFISVKKANPKRKRKVKDETIPLHSKTLFEKN